MAKWNTQWNSQSLRLRQNHNWKAKRNYQIIVVDRGAIRFDVPKEWVVSLETDEASGRTTVKVTDRAEPDDDCRLQVTVMYLPPGIDYTELSVTEMLEHAIGGPDEYEVLGRSDTVYEKRRDLEVAWIETRFVDPEEHREARTRSTLVRRADVQALLSFDYWPEDAERFLPVWAETTRSLRLAEYVHDPTRGSGH